VTGSGHVGEELADLSVVELLELYRKRQTSPSEVVDACLTRIDRLDPSLNATISVLADEARYQARELSSQLARRAMPDTPLAGIPFGVKDAFFAAGTLTTGGSAIYSEYISDEDSTVVSRLRSAGGILLAKLNTMEFNYGDEWNPHYGAARNPWNSECFAGGSSSGSGAAVAARMVPFAIGEDTGGSVRLPAANCGIVGLKPTYGRVPRTGMMGTAWSMDQPGPMTRSVVDAALVLRVIAGADRLDPMSSPRSVPDYVKGMDGGLEGVRIGVPTSWFFEGIDPQVDRAVRAGIAAMEGAGALIEEIDLPLFQLSSVVAWIVVGAEFASLHDVMRARLEEYDQKTAIRLVGGEVWPAQDYLRAQRIRHLMQLECQKAFERVDVVAVPGAPSAAGRFVGRKCVVRIGTSTRSWFDVSPRSTLPFSLTGMPAIVVPCGFDDQGMPIGLQIAAPPHQDGLALRVGYAYEQLAGFTRARPPIL
jgi:aspartyl-tRNA(Asn)/glutamyl-tRNA(Gln) amidotransferase subunit A